MSTDGPELELPQQGKGRTERVRLACRQYTISVRCKTTVPLTFSPQRSRGLEGFVMVTSVASGALPLASAEQKTTRLSGTSAEKADEFQLSLLCQKMSVSTRTRFQIWSRSKGLPQKAVPQQKRMLTKPNVSRDYDTAMAPATTQHDQHDTTAQPTIQLSRSFAALIGRSDGLMHWLGSLQVATGWL